MTKGRYGNPISQSMNQQMIPSPRLGAVVDIAATIACWYSPGGEFINGQVIVVDDGWSATKYLSGFGLNSARVMPKGHLPAEVCNCATGTVKAG